MEPRVIGFAPSLNNNNLATFFLLHDKYDLFLYNSLMNRLKTFIVIIGSESWTIEFWKKNDQKLTRLSILTTETLTLKIVFDKTARFFDIISVGSNILGKT